MKTFLGFTTGALIGFLAGELVLAIVYLADDDTFEHLAKKREELKEL